MKTKTAYPKWMMKNKLSAKFGIGSLLILAVFLLILGATGKATARQNKANVSIMTQTWMRAQTLAFVLAPLLEVLLH